MEEVFDFREFIIKILRNFRLLFVFALLFFIIVTGYKLHQVWPILTGVQPAQASPDSASQALVAEQKGYLNDQILYYEQCIQYFQSHLDILTKVDLTQLYSLRRVVLIDVESGMEHAGRIAELYVSLSQNMEFYEWLADKLESYALADSLQELVTVQLGSGQGRSSEHGFLSIHVYGDSPEFCTAAANNVWEYINKEINVHNILDEPYSLILINPTTAPMTDGSLLEGKLKIIQQIKDNTSILGILRNELKLLEDAPVIITKSSALKSVLKYAVLGLVVGLGMGLIWIFFFDVMDLRVRNSKEVRTKFGLTCLAELYDERTRPLFARIDEWIDRLDGIGFVKPTEEQSAEILAASLKELTERTVQKIMLTGDLHPDRLERLKAGLAEKMGRVDVLCAGDITISPETLALAEECEEIVLVLRKNESTYPAVEKQLRFLDNIGKSVLGFILVQ